MKEPNLQKFRLRGERIRMDEWRAEFFGQASLEALCHSQANELKAMVAAGMNVHRRDSDGYTLLHEAAMQGNAEMAQYLIESGVSVNSYGSDKKTPLHCACDPNVVRVLIENGADLDKQCKYGMTPLHKSLMRRESENANEVIRLLILSGARTDIRDQTRSDAEYTARQMKNQVFFEAIAARDKKELLDNLDKQFKSVEGREQEQVQKQRRRM